MAKRARLIFLFASILLLTLFADYTSARVNRIFVIGSGLSGDVIFALDSNLNIVGQVDLGGTHSFAKLVPPGKFIAVVTLVLQVDRLVARLLRVDTDSLWVTDLGPLEDIPAMINGDGRLLLTAERVPNRVGIIRLGELIPPAPVTLDLVDLETASHTIVPLPVGTRLATLRSAPSTPVLVFASTDTHQLFQVNTVTNAITQISTGPFAPDPTSFAGKFPLEGLQIDEPSNSALTFVRTGTRAEIVLKDGSVKQSSLNIPGIGTDAFVDKVRFTRTPAFSAIGVTRRGLGDNWIAAVHFFNRNWVNIGTVSNLSAFDFEFSPQGTELVVLGSDGTVALHRVPTGGQLEVRVGLLAGSGSKIIGIQ
jgi:hypothetical protein